MRILLLSDTHGYLDDDILAHAAEADELWHAGDVGGGDVLERLKDRVATVRAVYGNIDGGAVRRDWPEDALWESAGLNVYMTHIGGYPGRYNPRARAVLDAHPGVGLFICGHSHILKVMPDRRRGLLHMNPGACGQHGFHRIRTMLRFGIEAGRVVRPEVVELGRRGELRSRE